MNGRGEVSFVDWALLAKILPGPLGAPKVTEGRFDEGPAPPKFTEDKFEETPAPG